MTDADKTADKQQIGRPFPKGVSGNPKGRPKGSISLLTDIKKRLEKLGEEDPEKYEELIDYYWKNPRMRKLLIEQIDGMPKQPLEHSGKLSLTEFLDDGDNKGENQE